VRLKEADKKELLSWILKCRIRGRRCTSRSTHIMLEPTTHARTNLAGVFRSQSSTYLSRSHMPWSILEYHYRGPWWFCATLAWNEFFNWVRSNETGSRWFKEFRARNEPNGCGRLVNDRIYAWRRRCKLSWFVDEVFQ
jgi:hypothetical protein